jgi:hypothetical protein
MLLRYCLNDFDMVPIAPIIIIIIIIYVLLLLLLLLLLIISFGTLTRFGVMVYPMGLRNHSHWTHHIR